MSGNLAIWRELPGSTSMESLGGPASPRCVEAGHSETLASGAPRADPNEPSVQLHFNLWRDFETASDFFDVGIQIEHTDQIRRLLIFVSDKVEPSDVLDLNSLLKHPDSLNAVFNDVVNIIAHAEGSFDIEKGPGGARQKLRLHEVGIGSDLTFEPVATDDGEVGTLLILGERICARLSDDACDEHYVRFRIKLTGNLRDLFSRDVTPDDWWLLSSFMTTGITEFRLNERRTMPRPVIRRFDDGRLRIRMVHYFLIRDLRHELAVQHKDFSKIRTLESDIWKHYLRGRHPASSTDSRPIRRLNDDRLVIYHWKQPFDTTSEIEEFNAFAKFRSPRTKFWIYGIAIALLGALGSALQAVMMSFVARSNLSGLALPELPTLRIGWDHDALLTFSILVALILALVGFFNRKRWFGSWK